MSARPKTLRLLTLSLLTILLALTYRPALGAVWRVDGQNGVDPTGCTGGTTWATAFKTIQKAIDCAVAGDGIWVKKGTYAPTSTINVNKAVEIYGGFAGVETQWSKRNWETNVTTVDGQQKVTCFTVTANATIDGFSIVNGHGVYDPFPGSGYTAGGAIVILECSPTISNCRLSANYATNGGAIYSSDLNSSPIISNCIFSRNGSDPWGTAIKASSATIANCIFEENYSAESDGGSAIEGSNLDITGCKFLHNGGYPGAINVTDSTISTCSFEGNRRGAAFIRDSVITNCTFLSNGARDHVGALFANGSSFIGNCIFINNGVDGGAVATLLQERLAEPSKVLRVT